MNEAVLREARARIAEIDQQLGAWNRLMDERTQLQGLISWYEENLGQVPLFPNSGSSGIHVVPANRSAMADKRFHPRADSNTSRIVRAANELLRQRSDGTMTFTELAALIPREITGSGEHWKEFIRTAIKRAGGRYGIVYESGGVIRLVKRPQAMKT